MVKFGRHVDFFVANELDSARRLYVVPYADVRTRCIEIPGETVELPGKAIPPAPAASRAPPPPPPRQKPPPASGLSALFGDPAGDGPAAPPKPPAASGLSALFGDPAGDGPAAPPKPPPASGLSALFGDPAGDGPAVPPCVPGPKHSIYAGPAGSAVTLNAGTGAELAGLVKNLLIHPLHNKPAAALIPHEYGYGDPCNDDDAADARRVEETPAIDREAQAIFLARRFQTDWRICLKRASVDFERAMQLFWSEVFEGVKSYHQNGHSYQTAEEEKTQDAIRGALPDDALQMYVAVVPPERAQETFSFMKAIHSTALINSEALRKLVKKFDKMHYRGEKFAHMLSAKLLPEVYSSNFTGGLSSVEAGLALFRALLKMDEEEIDTPRTTAALIEEKLTKKTLREEKRLIELGTVDDDMRDVAVLSGGYFGNKPDTEEDTVQRRKKELQWLRDMVKDLDPHFIPNLVAHRGFHSIHDRSDVRPLENSLTAYEAAWTNGLHLCECDIALTKDERIILAHDENFARLGMDPASPLARRTVRDMTFREIMELPLKSGARPPLLFDVLRSAAAIGGDAKMIVEIKAGNTEASSALARLFMRNPQLMDRVAVVMSFDAFIMHSLRREMASVFEYLYGQQQHHQQSDPTVIPIGDSPAVPIYRKTQENGNIGQTAENAVYPLTAPALSNIALGSCLSTSPHIKPSFMSHNRAPSKNRLPSRLGGHHRLESRDFFGLGIDLASDNDALGMNLAEIDNSMSQSSTFLPIHKSQHVLQPKQANHEETLAEEEKAEEKVEARPSPPHNAVADAHMKSFSFPKLLLITVAEPPKAVYELFVDMTEQDKGAANHPNRLDGWLRGGDGGTLDGVYVQYQKAMMGPEGAKAMRNLAARYDVGIWGANPVPDDWGTFHSLVSECHVSYVNTSLPRHFRRKMKKSMSANTLAMNGILAAYVEHP